MPRIQGDHTIRFFTNTSCIERSLTFALTDNQFLLDQDVFAAPFHDKKLSFLEIRSMEILKERYLEILLV